jgi:hypothetical protein
MLDISHSRFEKTLNQNLRKYITNFDLLPIDIQNFIIELQHGKFVSLDIRCYVENNLHTCKHYTSEHMDLYVFTSNLDDIINDELLKQIYIVSRWIYDMNPIYRIKFIYFDTPIAKQLSDDNFISSANVNSGLSVLGQLIMIWRREDILKVLIHEIIHYLDMDLKNNKQLNIFKSIGNINYPIIVNETITELQAQFLHSVYISVVNYDGNIDTFYTIYNYEQIFSWYQFAKIMAFFNIKKFKSKELSEKFNQSSNVFAYYILKSIFTLKWTHILFELLYLPSVNKFETSANVFKIILDLINNLDVKLLNKIIKKLKSHDKSMKMTVFSKF